jgi:hypothetical protein
MPAHVERLCDVGRLDVAPRLGLTVLHVDLLGARESDTPEVQAVTTDATVPLGQVLTGRVRRIAYLAHELGIMTADHDNEGTKQTNELELSRARNSMAASRTRWN